MDRSGRIGTVLEGPIDPSLCQPGHPDAVPVRFDHADDLRQELNEIHVSRIPVPLDRDMVYPCEVPVSLWRRVCRAAPRNGLGERGAIREALRMWLLKYGDDEAKNETRREIGLDQ